MIVAYSFISHRLLRGGVGAARRPPRPNPRRGTPPTAKNERAVDEIHPRVRRATGEIIPDNHRRQTNPAESRSGCVNLSSLASVNLS